MADLRRRRDRPPLPPHCLVRPFLPAHFSACAPRACRITRRHEVSRDVPSPQPSTVSIRMPTIFDLNSTYANLGIGFGCFPELARRQRSLKQTCALGNCFMSDFGMRNGPGGPPSWSLDIPEAEPAPQIRPLRPSLQRHMPRETLQRPGAKTPPQPRKRLAQALPGIRAIRTRDITNQAANETLPPTIPAGMTGGPVSEDFSFLAGALPSPQGQRQGWAPDFSGFSALVWRKSDRPRDEKRLANWKSASVLHHGWKGLRRPPARAETGPPRSAGQQALSVFPMRWPAWLRLRR